MVNEKYPVDSGGTCVSPCHPRGACHVREVGCSESTLHRPLLFCLPASLTYVCDACLFFTHLAVLPALSRVPFISTSFLKDLGSLIWFIICAGIALFPGIINPHDVGYFYVIQYAKFWFVWWQYICDSRCYVRVPTQITRADGLL